VWKTVNNGTTFEAQFQDMGLMSIGDIAVSQNNPDLVYVGTGESNNRQSTSWGDGVFKSTDGGKTYTNVGLKASKHINRIVIDPRNNDVVWVAGDRTAVRFRRRARHLQDHRRRQDVEADAESRRRHRRQRSGDRSGERQHPVRLDVSAPAHGVLHERRRTRQRHLEVHRWRRDVDALEDRPARGLARPHRPRHLSQAAQQSVCLDRRPVGPGAAAAAVRPVVLARRAAQVRKARAVVAPQARRRRARKKRLKRPAGAAAGAGPPSASTTPRRASIDRTTAARRGAR
jgi:hypothetical protein